MFPRAFRIATIRGIDVRVDPSWLVIAALVVWSFTGRFTSDDGYDVLTAVIMAVGGAVGFFASVLAHELGHALEARHRDVRVEGITLFLFGGVTEMHLSAKRPFEEFALAAVGPYVSLVMGAALGLVTATLDSIALWPALTEVTGLLGWLNLGLGLFNLIPGAPLDGGRVLRSIVWGFTGDRQRAVRVAARAGQGVALLLVAGAVWFGLAADDLGNALWLGFIGWFLWHAARTELRQSHLEELFGDHTAGDLVPTDAPDLPRDRDLSLAADQLALAGGVDVLAVLEDGVIVGALRSHDLESVHPSDRAVRIVDDIMVPLGRMPAVRSDTPVQDALQALQRAEVIQVRRDDEIVGFLSHATVARGLDRLRGAAATPRPQPDDAAHPGTTPRGPRPVSAPVETTTPTPPGSPPPGGRLRRWFYRVSAIVVGLALFLVPMPYEEEAPGGARPVAPLVELEGVDTTPIDGDLRLVTVSSSRPSLVGLIRSLLDESRTLIPAEEALPEGIDRDDYFAAQRQIFSRSFDIAATVGAEAAGYEVTLVTAPLVVQVLPTSPADGVLEAADQIVSARGEPVADAAGLIDALQGLQRGEEVELTVERDGELLDVTVVADQVPGMSRPGLGILLDTAVIETEFPFEVNLAQTRIGGPSAGLVIALTVYDLLAPEDLVAGRNIAATGTLDAGGGVGRIGGVEAKVFAAAAEGATLFLAPDENAEAARAVAPDGMTVIGVGSFDEALDALRRSA